MHFSYKISNISHVKILTKCEILQICEISIEDGIGIVTCQLFARM